MNAVNFYMVVLWLVLAMNNCQGLKKSANGENCCLYLCRCSDTKRRDITVDCSDRDLTEVPRCKWAYVKTLELQGNNIRTVSVATMQAWKNLRNLDLSNNQLSSLPMTVNVTMKLRELNLEHNRFTAVPSKALSKMPRLKKISLKFNSISSIHKNAFHKQRKLEDLIVRHNNLTYIHPGFMGRSGGRLVRLDLSNTKLKRLPFASIRKLKKLQSLNLKATELEEIPDLAFQHLNDLAFLDIEENDYLHHRVGRQAFCFLPALQKLSVVNAELKHFPNLTGTPNLTVLQLQLNAIEEIPDDLCAIVKHLELIDMNHNKVKRIPSLKSCSKLLIVNIDHNQIEQLGNAFQGASRVIDITLNGNKIESIGEDDFEGLKNLEALYLKHNKITSIHGNAFSSFKQIRKIALDDNQFPTLPTKGLQTVTDLSFQGNARLIDFPSPKYFPKLQRLKVHSPYHCCYFALKKKSKTDDDDVFPELTAEIVWLTSENASNDTDADFGYSGEYLNSTNDFWLGPPGDVVCTPEPDPFFPCKDLMGDWVLRCGVWVVFLLALAGNATVIIVILASHTKMDVSRFLISNLAFADLFMGIYLGFLAVVDVTTFGDFKQYALEWQLSSGCQTAGFLAVLSSELSVFTLTVITLERYIAIKNAIRVNRKLELKTAMVVMAIGWLFAIATASLPLVQISSYGKFSVCLPFETDTTPSIVFLTVLLCLNASAFVVILFCYILMYCSIRGSNAWNASDLRVAKRMALLVITDFLCWAPIVFLSLTAAFGSTLVSLDHAKIITIFVFPLNSCANPFLYAIFTSHFKKDLVAICRRVEEKYPIFKITRNKLSFSRRSSYSGAASENANFYLRIRKYSLPLIGRGLQNSVTSHDKGGSSGSSNANNKTAETNALVTQNIKVERETPV